MLISTPVTQLLRIDHPILLAPMDIVADGRLVAAVDAAGGFGILGGGYGEEKWLVRELDVLERAKARFGVGFITWSMAKQPRLLDLALERRPAAVMLAMTGRVRLRGAADGSRERSSRGGLCGGVPGSAMRSPPSRVPMIDSYVTLYAGANVPCSASGGAPPRLPFSRSAILRRLMPDSSAKSLRLW